MKKIAIYVRKSVYKENSESIETQINMCKAYFTRQFKDCEFEIFEDEGFSGKNTDRPSFKRLMQLCKLRKFNIVTVYKIDRLARNIVDFMNIYNELEKLEIKLISITEGFDPTTPIGKMMMVMLAGFADMERMNIAQRVKDNMIALAKKGCYTGGPINKGYTVELKDDGKKYFKLENEEFIKFIFEKFDNGYSLLSVLRMQKEKFGSYAFNSTLSIRNMLRSPVYARSNTDVNSYLRKKGYEIVGTANNKTGYITYGVSSNEPTAIVSKHKTAISSELWLSVNAKLDKINKTSIKKTSKCYWLTGILKCPKCGQNYILANANHKCYYTCSTRLKRGKNNPDACNNNKYIKAELIEKIVEDMIEKFLDKDLFLEEYSSKEIDVKDDTVDIEKQLNKNEDAIKKLVEKLTVLSNEASKFVTDKINELTKTNTDLKIKLEETKLSLLENKLNKSNPTLIYNNILNFSLSKNLEQKRHCARLIFDSIFYDPLTNSIKIEFI